jgi:hypothetical protein
MTGWRNTAVSSSSRYGVLRTKQLNLAVGIEQVQRQRRSVPSGRCFRRRVLGLFLWQSGNYFRRNRPGSYRPDALPKLLVPGG